MKLTLFICLLLVSWSGNTLAATKDNSAAQIQKCEVKYKSDVQKKNACIAKVKKAQAKANAKTAKSKSTSTTNQVTIKECETTYKSNVVKKNACIAKVKKTQTTSSPKVVKTPSVATSTSNASKLAMQKCETQYKTNKVKKNACIAEVKKSQRTTNDTMVPPITTNIGALTKQCETKYKNDDKKKNACVAQVKKNEQEKNQDAKLLNQQQSSKAVGKVDSGKSSLAQSKKTSSKILKVININSATATEMASSLPGVGATKAQAIVDYRNQYGKFKSPSDLAKVKGLGDKSVAKMAPYLKY